MSHGDGKDRRKRKWERIKQRNGKCVREWFPFWAAGAGWGHKQALLSRSQQVGVDLVKVARGWDPRASKAWWGGMENKRQPEQKDWAEGRKICNRYMALLTNRDQALSAALHFTVVRKRMETLPATGMCKVAVGPGNCCHKWVLLGLVSLICAPSIGLHLYLQHAVDKVMIWTRAVYWHCSPEPGQTISGMTQKFKKYF